MTAETALQGNDYKNSSILPRLTLIAAGATIFFAVLSLILSNRLETLRVEYQDTIHRDSGTGVSAELNSGTAKFNAMRQAMESEKAMTEKLRKKITALTQESEKIKSELASAQKTIADLRSDETPVDTMEMLPSSNSSTSDSSPKAASPAPDLDQTALLPNQ